jgi:hypothetical protein
MEQIKKEKNVANKRDLKAMSKMMNEPEVPLQMWKTPKLPCQIPETQKPSMIEVFHEYQKRTSKEYFMRMLYFTQMLTTY